MKLKKQPILLLFIVFVLILSGCSVSCKFYSEKDILNHLEKKYNKQFVIKKLKYNSKHVREYSVSLKDDPSIKFTAQTSWYDGYNPESLPIFYIPSGRNPIKDDYINTCWIVRVSPLLAKYRITDTFTDKSLKNDFNVITYPTNNVNYRSLDDKFCFVITDDMDLNNATNDIYTLIKKINHIEPFSKLPKLSDEGAEDSPPANTYVVMAKYGGKVIKFSINYPYTKKLIYDQLINETATKTP